jgi:hypothetical protein
LSHASSWTPTWNLLFVNSGQDLLFIALKTILEPSAFLLSALLYFEKLALDLGQIMTTQNESVLQISYLWGFQY